MKNEIFTTFKFIAIVLPMLFFINSCNKPNPFDADISEVSIDSVKISRYEKALFEANPYDLLSELKPFTEEFSFFIGEGLQTEHGQQQLFEFVTDRFLQELYFDVVEKYPSIEFLEEELTKAFRYYRYYYPNQSNPKIFTYVSGLDSDMPIKYADDNVIIGLDMYLGKTYLNYERASIPVFKRLYFTEDYISSDVMKIMAEKNMQSEVNVPDNFLDFMIYEGKALYFLDLMLPHTPDSIKIQYTSPQLIWMEKNAKQVWTYLIDNEILFTQDKQVIRKFVGEAPFTTVFGNESAPRVGVWLGWQIVRQYMKRHSEATIQQLLNEKKPQEILNKSGYKPR